MCIITLPNNVHYIIQNPSILKTKLIYKTQVNNVQEQ